MDEIVGLLADAIAKRVKEANARAAPPARANVAPRRPPAAPPATVSAAAAVPLSSPAAAPAFGAVPALDAVDPFGGLSGSIAPPAAAAPGAASLLRAFAGGDALLAGIVLAEALAPPVALRDNLSRSNGV